MRNQSVRIIGRAGDGIGAAEPLVEKWSAAARGGGERHGSSRVICRRRRLRKKSRGRGNSTERIRAGLIMRQNLRRAQRVSVNCGFVHAAVEWIEANIGAGANMAVRAGIGEITHTTIDAHLRAVDVEDKVGPVKRDSEVIPIEQL